MITLKDVTKKYGKFTAVDNLNLEIEEGDSFGFLGPNGAGKTTTILMAVGILRPTYGEIKVFDKDIRREIEIKKRIGVVSEQQYLYNNMTAYEYLNFFAELYDVDSDRVNEILDYMRLSDVKNKLLKEYSKGMRQKISVARAVLHDPDILILDEPAYGLDPKGVKKVRDLILAEKKKGKTIFISSHILTEIEKVCDNVGIIDKGKLVFEGKMDELKRKVSGGRRVYIELYKITKKIADTLKKLSFVQDISIEENIIQITTEEDKRKEISEIITESGGVIIGMHEESVSLEDAFLRVIENE
ncbi:MAG TPA: ABC transporter ATP-binding protein [Methanomicrobia archaeon]|nr:ABC transporter ATP-binding protein [Methanomicrobia archaeon]